MARLTTRGAEALRRLPEATRLPMLTSRHDRSQAHSRLGRAGDSQRSASQSTGHCASNECECTSAAIMIFRERSHPAFSVCMKRT